MVGKGKVVTDAEVTQTSTPSTTSSSSCPSSSSSTAASPWPFAPAVPFVLLCAPFTRPESAGAAARSLAWRTRVADGEWRCRIGGPE